MKGEDKEHLDQEVKAFRLVSYKLGKHSTRDTQGQADKHGKLNRLLELAQTSY